MSSLTIYQGSFLYILFSRQNKPICEKIRDNSFIASDHTSGESEVNVPEVNPAPWFDLHWFHDFFNLFFFTNADVETIKDETSEENLWN